MFEGTDGVLDGVGQLVPVKVELLQLLDLSEGVLRGLDVRDEVLLQIQMLEARQPSEDVPLHNLNLISLQVESVHLLAELPAVILDIVHLVVTKTQHLKGDKSIEPAFIDRHDLNKIVMMRTIF